MKKPKKEDFGFIFPLFPDTNSQIRYKIANKKYLSWKRIENKNILIEDIIDNLWDNIYSSEEYIKDLCREALNRRTQKELKEINA